MPRLEKQFARALCDGLDHERTAKVMAAMDEANKRWDRATVMPAAVGIASKSGFTTKIEMPSLRFTTKWVNCRLVARAS
jgi:DNA polymerase V